MMLSSHHEKISFLMLCVVSFIVVKITKFLQSFFVPWLLHLSREIIVPTPQG